jgi:AraC-like DNA-binding protein
MNSSTFIDGKSVFIFFGIFQGFILSAFYLLKPSSKPASNRYQGLLLLVLSLIIFEQTLCLTGLIVKVLFLTNSTVPLNLTIGPLLFLYVKKSIDQSDSEREWIHFILFIIFLGYMFLEFIQPIEFKYNSYVNSFHPDWSYLKEDLTIPSDPLKINGYINPFTAIHILFYISLSVIKLIKMAHQSGESILHTDNEIIRSLRNTISHILLIILIFIIVKVVFHADLGDYFISLYVIIFIFFTTFRIMNNSASFDQSTSFMEFQIVKYQKSSLSESGKQKILEDIILELEANQYFSDNLASLSELAKKIGQSSHHVSQVINEKLNKNFYELLAQYRVDKAKEIITVDRNNKLKIEEISEMVGYNSKTAFNNAFRKLSGKTPSEFRRSING